MRSQAAAEAVGVDTPERPAKPAAARTRPARKAPAKAAAPRKRAAAPKPEREAEAAPGAVQEPAPEPVEAPRPSRRRRRLLLRLLVPVVVAASAAAAVYVFVLRDDPAQELHAGVPAIVSAEALESFAGSGDAAVYWAGPDAARRLELTVTDAGAFVRYLPAGTRAGDTGRALTIGTYPLQDAYATAQSRATSDQMTARQVPGGGVAVWSRVQPSSVYLAYPGVPHLIEIYAPQAAEARELALSGRVRPAG